MDTPPYFRTHNYRFYYKVGSNTTITDSYNTAIFCPVAPIRGLAWLDIYRGANVAWMSYANSTSVISSQTDYTTRRLYDAMETDGTVGFGSFAQTYTSVNYAGAWGFDAVSISWNNNINPILISDLLITRFY